MKKLISPKDVLFVGMLFLIFAVGIFGFTQSMKFKNKPYEKLSAHSKETKTKKDIK